MKILVTGVAGFIGSHLTESFLDMGYEVTGIDNISSFYSKEQKLLNLRTLRDKGLKFIETDLSQILQPLPKDFDYVFHLAAQPGLDQGCMFDDYIRNNIIATENLVSLAKSFPTLKLFVNISTSSVYGLNATQSEESIVRPISWYGITKSAAEQLVLSAHTSGYFKACSLRLYSVYGPRERPDKLYSKLIHCGLNDLEFTLFKGSLEHRRSFSYIDDIVRGIAAVQGKEERVSGQIINIGSKDSYTTMEGIAIIEQLIKKRIKLREVPERPGDQKQTAAVIDKATSLLGFVPEIPLSEGLHRQLLWTSKNLRDITWKY
ncbi:NAD-dependent epimerase/dehydratase family protein [Sphingobacterium deserti]|uniref:NAD-dependent epimerase/dehydratase family protein n=1 Tax=Sphingobacterium deserti TaxID=1229276 RepID=A0A0B8T6D5_9SPHI|nr:NAD-dependent epimerase/dehydratase family protein [Sphingobacterium deserti]KGE12705.1 NAD-dependent epimerase/dehydratase family protein [Sphingobacterium deserti]